MVKGLALQIKAVYSYKMLSSKLYRNNLILSGFDSDPELWHQKMEWELNFHQAWPTDVHNSAA